MGRRRRAASLFTIPLVLSGLVALAGLAAEPLPALASPGPSAKTPAATFPRDTQQKPRAPKKAKPPARTRAKVREPQVADPGRHHPTLPAGILSHPHASRSPVPEHSLLPHSLPSAGPRASSDRELFIWPVVGPLNSPYGPRRARFHAGIDIGAAQAHPVVAAGGGRVVYARATRGPLGKTVVLEHADGLRTLYAHLSRIVAKEGALVRQGDRIGAVGRTGRATGPHLHFEIHRHGAPVAPQAFLPGPPGELVHGPAASRPGPSEAHILPSQPPGAEPASTPPIPSDQPTS